MLDRKLLQIVLGILQAGLAGKQLEFKIQGNFEYDTILGSVRIPVNEMIPLKLGKRKVLNFEVFT